MYEIYDVYNNAYSNGGTLNVTLDRYFQYSDKDGGNFTDSNLSRKSKYSNRHKMTDITLRMGIVVKFISKY